MYYRIGSVTNIGKVRKQNEDRYLVKTCSEKGRSAALLVVADGMGGLDAGEIASSDAVAGMEEWWQEFQNGDLSEEDYSASLDRTIYQVNRRIFDFSSENGVRTGTTLSALLLYDDAYIYKQIGDRRIYQRGKSGIRQITRDQNLMNQQLEGQGSIREFDARRAKALVNALGPTRELSIVTGSGVLERSCAFLLCSDGFYGPLEEDILDESSTWGCGKQPQADLNRMLAQVLAGDARDNATAILCCVTKRRFF